MCATSTKKRWIGFPFSMFKIFTNLLQTKGFPEKMSQSLNRFLFELFLDRKLHQMFAILANLICPYIGGFEFEMETT